MDVIKFLEELGAELVHQADPWLAAAQARESFDKDGQATHQGKVHADGMYQIRPLNLDSHFDAFVGGGMVDLTQAGSGKGLGVKLSEQGLGLPTQLFFDAGKGYLVGEGRQPVVEGGEDLKIGQRQQIGPGAERLPDLDKGRSKRDEVGQEPLGAPSLPIFHSLAATVGPGPSVNQPVPQASQQDAHDLQNAPQRAPEAYFLEVRFDGFRCVRSFQWYIGHRRKYSTSRKPGKIRNSVRACTGLG